MAKIKVAAILFGVFTAKNGEILHFDPKNEDERYHHPTIDEEDLPAAIERGLVNKDDPTRGVKEVEDERDPHTIGSVAAERVSETAKIDAKASDLPSNLDTRQSVAWNNEDRARIQGGQHGHASSELLVDQILDADNPDAPPAPAAAPAPTPTPTPTPAPAAAPKAAAPKAAPKQAMKTAAPAKSKS